MSAYSASAPVTHSTTAPSTTKARYLYTTQSLKAYHGDTASSTSGRSTICMTPSTARTTNHSAMTGPNTRPTLWVPRYCIANSAIITTMLIGSTYSFNVGAATCNPSTAESTEIAGVMMPSPKNRPAPTMPIKASVLRMAVFTATRCASAMSASIPPSPWLSARITSITYFTVTISTSDQKNSDRMPRISTSLIGTPSNTCMLALSAYSGLVPMSP